MNTPSFYSSEGWTQGLVHIRQAPYQLNSSPTLHEWLFRQSTSLPYNLSIHTWDIHLGCLRMVIPVFYHFLPSSLRHVDLFLAKSFLLVCNCYTWSILFIGNMVFLCSPSLPPGTYSNAPALAKVSQVLQLQAWNPMPGWYVIPNVIS